MEDMLNAMDDDWPVKPGDVDDAFNPQEVFPSERQHHLQPGLEDIAPDGLVNRETEGLDVVVMPIDIIVIMVVMPVMTVMRVLVSLFLQPVLHVRTFGLRVVHTRVEERFRVDYSTGGCQLWRPWI